jgi:type VI secretion system secreted protein VgrG
MTGYTQASRPMRVSTALGEDVLLLTGFRAAEGISTPFAIELDLVSEDSAIVPDDVLRSAVVVTVSLPDGTERHFHGLVNRFSQGPRDADLTSYRAEVVPWLWFLSLTRGCRIHQNKSVPDIVETVFRDLGYADFRIDCTREYPPREFCVQYRETALDFVSRLLEEEGIFYFFEHSDSKHELVLADSDDAIHPCLLGKARMAAHPRDDDGTVLSLDYEHAIRPARVELADYDYLQPRRSLVGAVKEDGPEELYDYHPGRYTTPEEGERYARVQLEGERALREAVRGEGTCRDFQAGCSFELSDHYRPEANQEYVLLQVNHSASGSGYRSAGAASLDYRNTFLAIPSGVPYRPPQKTPRPRIRGSQTALVVGPAGEEIHTDSYGRVKIQFYWDREGKKDENSSCWVRVATPWGGKGYGSVTIPRIGNEVVVLFLEGDPDRPLVVASVFNADQMPPYGLPGAGITMGMKSRSSPGGGGQNEITMNDTKGKEVVNVNAQYDMKTTVGHDDTQTIKNDRTITVDGKHTETITKDCKITIDGKYTSTIKQDTAVTITEGNHTVTVSAGTQTNTVNNDIMITSKSTLIHAKAATEIKLEVGASSLLMKSDGTIEMKGVNISLDGTAIAIKGSAAVEIKGGIVNSIAASQHQTKGAMVLSEGSATNTIKGGMVMLNP